MNRIADRALQALAVVLTLGLLAVLAALAVRSLRDARRPVQTRVGRMAVAPQIPPGPVRAAALRDLPALPARLPGVPILAYHGISDIDADRYTVTRGQFAEQMAALRRAGFTAISDRLFARYVAGGRVRLPARPVLITFDDGIKSVWVHGDPVLKREGLRATMYIITGRVSRNQPYYLTWAEVERMRASGRWDFGSHTHEGHRYVATGPETTGPFLTSRAWMPAAGRPETVAEWRVRVERDLDRAARMFADHGLPPAVSFADPFSASAGRARDRVVLRPLRELSLARYRVLVNNRIEPKLARVGDEHHYIRRIEIFRGTGGAGLLRQISVAVARTR